LAYSYTVSEYLTVKEAAESLGVSARRVQQLISAGRLEAVKMGNALFIRPAALEAVQDRKPGRPTISESQAKPPAQSKPRATRPVQEETATKVDEDFDFGA
jgi:excisionase family DNA binding protein